MTAFLSARWQEGGRRSHQAGASCDQAHAARL